MPDAKTMNRAGQSRRDEALIAGWREGLSIVNLRGDPSNAGFRERVQGVIGIDLPEVGRTIVSARGRVVWVGPDDWFLVGAQEPAVDTVRRLHDALAGIHHAATDVSGGYTVLHLSGVPVLDVLAHGCPLDLHPRVFGVDACAGSHFFKASVWLWKASAASEFELLVRRSFRGYVEALLARCSAEGGLVTRKFA